MHAGAEGREGAARCSTGGEHVGGIHEGRFGIDIAPVENECEADVEDVDAVASLLDVGDHRGEFVKAVADLDLAEPIRGENIPDF